MNLAFSGFYHGSGPGTMKMNLISIIKETVRKGVFVIIVAQLLLWPITAEKAQAIK